MKSIKRNVTSVMVKAGNASKRLLRKRDGGAYVEQALIIITCVVLGVLLLAGLYLLFKDTLLPTLTQKIKDAFDYKG